MYELNVSTLAERAVTESPPGMIPTGRANATSDAKYVCSMLREEQPKRSSRTTYSYSQFRELFEIKPLSQIVRVDIETGDQEIILQDRRYMSHVNTSPTQNTLLTFCHEGPWDLVEQRIWCLNIVTGERWKVRPQDDENVAIGHEYWFAGGHRIGYHGRPRTGEGDHVFGWIGWDNTSHVEVAFPFRSSHFHSLDESLIVGDGTPADVFHRDKTKRPYIQLYRWDGERYIGPRLLAFHRSSFNDQYAHPHPRFTPDYRSVLFASDMTGYSNMYLVEIGDFDDLPAMEDILEEMVILGS